MNHDDTSEAAAPLPESNGHVPGRGGRSSSVAWDFIELLARRWVWLFLGGVSLAWAGWFAGLRLMQTSFTAQAQLIYYESPNAAEVFRPRPITLQTLASQLRAPELLQRVGAQMQPPLSAEGVAASSRLTPERGAEVIGLAVWGTDPAKTVELAN